MPKEVSQVDMPETAFIGCARPHRPALGTEQGRKITTVPVEQCGSVLDKLCPKAIVGDDDL